MGCFDTYIFPKCPWCGKKMEEQVKPGDMNYFRFGDDVMDDVKMLGCYTHWDGCKKSFYVEFETTPKIILRKADE